MNYDMFMLKIDILFYMNLVGVILIILDYILKKINKYLDNKGEDKDE